MSPGVFQVPLPHIYIFTHIYDIYIYINILQVGLRLRFCTGAQDTVLRVCAGMKAEPGDELSVSQVYEPPPFLPPSPTPLPRMPPSNGHLLY
jgi:hypothetical protein